MVIIPNRSCLLGTVIALYTVGGIFGALSCVYLGDLLGRRKVIFFTNFITIIGAVLMASAAMLRPFLSGNPKFPLHTNEARMS
jgi:MFS family permease